MNEKRPKTIKSGERITEVNSSLLRFLSEE